MCSRLPIIGCFVLLACGGSPGSVSAGTDDAVSAATRFFRLLKANDTKGLTALYPGLKNLQTWFSSDTATVVRVWERADTVAVCLRNLRTAGNGRKVVEEVDLFFRRESGRLVVVDSKGLAPLRQRDEYLFGVKTGCINTRTDSTDQQVLAGLRRARLLLPDKAFAMYVELKENIRLEDWRWDLNADGAFGEGVVRNDAALPVHGLRYRVIFRSRQGDTLAVDEGPVGYDTLRQGESRAFSFFTDGIPQATKASVEVLIDDALVLQGLARKAWTGKECQGIGASTNR